MAEIDKLIRTLITAAYAVCCDETPIRVGPRKVKKYLLVACTEFYTWYHLGDRTLATFKDFGLGELSGVVVHDRYQNYDSAVFAGLVHLLCTAHYSFVISPTRPSATRTRTGRPRPLRLRPEGATHLEPGRT